MSAIEYEEDQEAGWGEQQPPALPGRRQRRRWGRPGAVLIAVLTAAAGFYAGVRVEKGQLSSSTSASGIPATARTGASGSGSSGRSGFSGLRGAGSGTASIGTISSVDGNTIYITETSGNTVKVTLSSATKLTKSLGVSKSSLHPGDSVVVQGATSSTGTISATSVSDSGASNTSTTGSGSSTAGTRSSGSAGSAVSSLFGSSQ